MHVCVQVRAACSVFVTCLLFRACGRGLVGSAPVRVCWGLSLSRGYEYLGVEVLAKSDTYIPLWPWRLQTQHHTYIYPLHIPYIPPTYPLHTP